MASVNLRDLPAHVQARISASYGQPSRLERLAKADGYREVEDLLAAQLTAAGVRFDRQAKLVAERRWRWDFVVADLAVEVHGGTWSGGAHVRGRGFQRDCDKHNAAVLAGYRPLTFTTADVESGVAADVIERATKRETA